MNSTNPAGPRGLGAGGRAGTPLHTPGTGLPARRICGIRVSPAVCCGGSCSNPLQPRDIAADKYMHSEGQSHYKLLGCPAAGMGSGRESALVPLHTPAADTGQASPAWLMSPGLGQRAAGERASAAPREPVGVPGRLDPPQPWRFHRLSGTKRRATCCDPGAAPQGAGAEPHGPTQPESPHCSLLSAPPIRPARRLPPRWR